MPHAAVCVCLQYCIHTVAAGAIKSSRAQFTTRQYPLYVKLPVDDAHVEVAFLVLRLRLQSDSTTHPNTDGNGIFGHEIVSIIFQRRHASTYRGEFRNVNLRKCFVSSQSSERASKNRQEASRADGTRKSNPMRNGPRSTPKQVSGDADDRVARTTTMNFRSS